MPKDVTFVVDEPVSGDLAVRWWNFLIKAAEKREHIATVGTVREIRQNEEVS